MTNEYTKIVIHDQGSFSKMRDAGRCASDVLDYIGEYVQPGVTTLELDRLCHDMIINRGAIPACLGYLGFPKSICTSINHVVCHGIPDERKLQDGDIINIDVTTIVDGWYGDTSRMFTVGDSFLKKKPSTIKALKLMKVTYQAMMLGIEAAKPGAKISHIGEAIQGYVENFGFSVVRDYCGHGIGRVFHTSPNIPHFVDNESDEEILPGMFFTIEPMINAGKYDVILSKHDGWTVYTKDKSLSAQFEHTIGITNNGNEIFTLSSSGSHYPEALDLV